MRREPAHAAFKDKNLDEIMQKVQEMQDEFHEKNPQVQPVNIKSGLRGIRYFVEFPIVAQNVDAFSILSLTK